MLHFLFVLLVLGFGCQLGLLKQHTFVCIKFAFVFPMLLTISIITNYCV